jgi:NitT/TauT family transport system substrate-binding protein
MYARACLVALVMSVASAAACGAPGADVPGARVIRVSFTGTPDFGDLATHLAHDRLRAEGYVIEETSYSATDVAIDALARGSADIGVGSLTGAWMAAARGARLRTVMEHIANPHRLMVVPGIGDCGALDRRRLALHGEAAVGSDLIRAYLAEACPEARPVTMYLQGSENRAAALLAGTIDAAAVELGIVDWLEDQAPGRFRVLVDFAARWPSIKTTGVQVNMDFAAAHPDDVVAYVRALLAANRDLMADPGLVIAQAVRVLGPSDRWPRVAKGHIAAGTWPIDGGLTDADVARTLAFFPNEVLRGLSVDDVADLRFLNEALGERRPLTAPPGN